MGGVQGFEGVLGERVADRTCVRSRSRHGTSDGRRIEFGTDDDAHELLCRRDVVIGQRQGLEQDGAAGGLRNGLVFDEQLVMLSEQARRRLGALHIATEPEEGLCDAAQHEMLPCGASDCCCWRSCWTIRSSWLVGELSRLGTTVTGQGTAAPAVGSGASVTA